MATWVKGEWRKIAAADNLHIAPFREDGVTYGTPTWIWSVAVGDALMCAVITEPGLAGIKPRCGRKPAASSPPA